MKKAMGLLFHRSVLVGLSLLAQVLTLWMMIHFFSARAAVFYWCCILLSILISLVILGGPSDPAYKIVWLLLVLIFPVFGGLFYLTIGGGRVPKATVRRLQAITERSALVLKEDFKARELLNLEEDAAGQARYLEEYAACPVYTNTETEYLSPGEMVMPRILADLERARKYIFLEYFILRPGHFWDQVLDILERKAAQGVEVRLLYDDVGCMFTLPRNYDKKMAARGIQCRAFNRFIPLMSLRMNNRDHRKFTVIDGSVAYTGGMNLADEYVNLRPKYGHWKDSALRLEGDGVWSITVMFLSMWDHICRWEEDFSSFRPLPSPVRPWTGYVQPYTDTPLDAERVSQTVYLNMISRARKHIYITTPYLVIDTTTSTALCNAAKSGVEVKIITPGIPDKLSVFQVTRAHYPPLLEAGVEIYEYTPGFIHAKNFVVDDRYATVGTVNLDYRSLFLHFEGGVWLCEAPCIRDISRDFCRTLELCRPVEREQPSLLSPLKRIYHSFLRIFAPLM